MCNMCIRCGILIGHFPYDDDDDDDDYHDIQPPSTFYIHHTKQFQLSAFRSLLHSISFGFEWKREETKAALFSASVDLRFDAFPIRCPSVLLSSSVCVRVHVRVYCQKY